MKGCYVLIYRRVEAKPLIDADTNSDISLPNIRLPPTEIVEEIQRKVQKLKKTLLKPLFLAKQFIRTQISR